VVSNISKELIASIFRIDTSTLKMEAIEVTSTRKMKAIYSSEKPVTTYKTV
jgi:hypothetical protein